MRGRRGHLLLAIALAAAAAALAPPAAAKVTWVVEGRGFGHGVGMSQYGAYGYAKAGKGYRQILGHYYQGTTIGKLDKPRVVRVLLAIDAGDVAFTRATSACGRSLDPGAPIPGAPPRRRGDPAHGRRQAAGQLRCEAARRRQGQGADRRPGPLSRRARGGADEQQRRGAQRDQRAQRQPVREGRRPERDAGLLAAGGAARAGGRSALLRAHLPGRRQRLRPLRHTSSQVYEGAGSEVASTNQAATDTKGEVVEYQGKIAQTFFMASSGGRTESVENSFYGAPVPYLKSVRDPYDYYSPLHKWTLRLSAAQMNSRLASYLDGRLRRIVVTKRGASPRIVWARLYGTGGVTKIRGDSLEYALGGYDRWMHFKKVVDRQARAPRRRLIEDGCARDRAGAAAAGALAARPRWHHERAKTARWSSPAGPRPSSPRCRGVRRQARGRSSPAAGRGARPAR